MASFWKLQIESSFKKVEIHSEFRAYKSIEKKNSTRQTRKLSWKEKHSITKLELCFYPEEKCHNGEVVFISKWYFWRLPTSDMQNVVILWVMLMPKQAIKDECHRVDPEVELSRNAALMLLSRKQCRTRSTASSEVSIKLISLRGRHFSEVHVPLSVVYISV